MYFLGVDGGGSQTRAWLCDEAGNILGQGIGGPCNPCTQPRQSCFEHLQSAIGAAFGSRSWQSIRSAHLGVAGAGDPTARAVLDSAVKQLFEGSALEVGISHDLKIAHAAGFEGGAGSLLVAGTGSACYGLGSRGQEVLTGGWGDLIDDTGSGSWIGLRALQLSVRQADGRVAGGALLAAVLQFLGLSSVDQLKARVHITGLPRDERARLAPVIFDLAQSDDPLANRIVGEAVRELTLLARRNLEALSQPTPRLALMGGLAQSAFFREKLEASVRDEIPDVQISQPKLAAAAGALILAMQGAGITIDAPVLERLAKATGEATK